MLSGVSFGNSNDYTPQYTDAELAAVKDKIVQDVNTTSLGRDIAVNADVLTAAKPNEPSPQPVQLPPQPNPPAPTPPQPNPPVTSAITTVGTGPGGGPGGMD